MVLSDKDIRAEIKAGEIVVTPYQEKNVRPAALDLTLHENFRMMRNSATTHIDVKKEFDVTELVKAQADGSFIIHPREFVLGSTQEIITLPNHLVGLLEGRSSLGRIGLIVHATASFITPCFSGYLTLEMSNISNLPIKLYKGMCIAQLAFLQLSTPVSKIYTNRYQNQEPPTASRIWQDFIHEV